MATLSTTIIDDTLTVDGTLTAKSEAIVSGDLEVSGTSTLNKNVTIKEKGRLCISGDTDIAQNSNKAIAVYSVNSAEYGTEPIFSVGNATGVTDIAGKLTCAGPCQVDGNFYAKGTIEDSTFTVNTPATFNKTLTTQDVFNIKGTKAPENRPAIHFFFGNSSTATSFIDDYDGENLDINAKKVNLGRTANSSSTDPSYGWVVVDTPDGRLRPYTSGNYSLGSPTHLWSTVYATKGAFSGTCSASDWITNSLENIKTNINLCNFSALEEINKTEIYNYNLKNSLKEEQEKGYLHTGFVIGETHGLSEHLLSLNKDGINMYSSIAMSFKGIQELHQLVKNQQEEINNLKEKISLLKNKIG